MSLNEFSILLKTFITAQKRNTTPIPAINPPCALLSSLFENSMMYFAISGWLCILRISSASIFSWRPKPFAIPNISAAIGTIDINVKNVSADALNLHLSSLKPLIERTNILSCFSRKYFFGGYFLPEIRQISVCK